MLWISPACPLRALCGHPTWMLESFNVVTQRGGNDTYTATVSGISAVIVFIFHSERDLGRGRMFKATLCVASAGSVINQLIGDFPADLLRTGRRHCRR